MYLKVGPSSPPSQPIPFPDTNQKVPRRSSSVSQPSPTSSSDENGSSSSPTNIGRRKSSGASSRFSFSRRKAGDGTGTIEGKLLAVLSMELLQGPEATAYVLAKVPPGGASEALIIAVSENGFSVISAEESRQIICQQELVNIAFIAAPESRPEMAIVIVRGTGEDCAAQGYAFQIGSNEGARLLAAIVKAVIQQPKCQAYVEGLQMFNQPSVLLGME